MSDWTQRLLDAIAPLALAAKQQADIERLIAGDRSDAVERAMYLGRAARWEALHAAAIIAMQDVLPEMNGRDALAETAKEIPGHAIGTE